MYSIKEKGLALKSLRELRGLSRKEAGLLLRMNSKNIEKIENGRVKYSDEKFINLAKFYSFSESEYQLCLQGKIDKLKAKYEKQRPKVILNNKLRRSYKKIIDKKVETLIALRKLKGITQYQASFKCGYPKCSIGHIENGRIELPKERIEHIVKSYGYTIDQFEEHYNSETLITITHDECIEIIKRLSKDKLNAVYTMLKNF